MRHVQILIIDDDEDIREVAGLMLEIEGFQVAKAKDGLDAFEQLQAGLQPALILVDMMMPRMDGESFIAAMRADQRLAEFPVVVMSGHHVARQKAAELEADGCLVKPVEAEELLRVVRRFTSPAQGSSMHG